MNKDQQHTCRRCLAEPTREHEMVHELMDAIIETLQTTAIRLRPDHGIINAELPISALLSVIAHMINSLYRGGERTSEFQRCETFFRDEYVQ